ncbi:MAG: hypothetical protein EOP89_16920, partial [Lysobacteraceae bacterium]
MLAVAATTVDVNRFDNAAGATFLTLDTIGLGHDGLLTNAGLLTPGGVGALQTTELSGSFVQTGLGRFETDLDLGLLNTQYTDRINATGTASIGGRFVAYERNVTAITPGDRQSVLVSAPGGVTNTGASLSAVTSAIADFSLVFAPTTLSLRSNVDFATPGRTLNRNRTAVGDYFNRIQIAGSVPLLADTITTLFYTPDAASLGRRYDTFDGEIYAAQLASAVSSADRFAG